jgi:hypothetical protein
MMRKKTPSEYQKNLVFPEIKQRRWQEATENRSIKLVE